MLRKPVALILKPFVLLGLCVILLSACSSRQNQLLFQRKTAVIDTAAFAYLPVYKIRALDILQVKNLQSISLIVDDAAINPTGSRPTAASADGPGYQVEDDGTVALPVIGRVAVAGLSRMEAARKIEALYKKKLIKDPIIELKVMNMRITILGEVRSPGTIPLVNDRVRLIEALGQAGGLTDKGNEKNVKILRGDLRNPQIIEVDLGDVSSMANPVTILQNQDVVYVAQNKRAIRNENLQTFTTIAQPALLLLNTALIIFSLNK